MIRSEAEMSVSGLVFDLQRYCLHDGPGIRTVIFLKACPLACVWCANPESQRPQPELMLTSRPCLFCEECVKVCPREAITLDSSETPLPVPIINWSLCDLCLDCVDVCVSGTLSQIGQVFSLAEVMDIVWLDQPFYARSGGGVTLSGGEPTAQPEFSHAILEACKTLSIHTVIETSGFCDWDSLGLLLHCTDLIYFDLKQINSTLHGQYTGKSNERILENLRRLVISHDNIIVRFPLIPGYNDDDDQLLDVASYLASIDPHLKLELIPFHQLGCSKYVRLGRTYALEGTAPIALDRRVEREQFLQSHGVNIVQPMR